MDIAVLDKEARSLREIAKLADRIRNTIRRVIREKVPRAFRSPSRSSRLYSRVCRHRRKENVRNRENLRKCGYTSAQCMGSTKPPSRASRNSPPYSRSSSGVGLFQRGWACAGLRCSWTVF